MPRSVVDQLQRDLAHLRALKVSAYARERGYSIGYVSRLLRDFERMGKVKRIRRGFYLVVK